MTRGEAVRSFTSWNAWAAGQEAELGSLEPGKRADLVVLDDEVFTCDEARLKDVTALLTHGQRRDCVCARRATGGAFRGAPRLARGVTSVGGYGGP